MNVKWDWLSSKESIYLRTRESWLQQVQTLSGVYQMFAFPNDTFDTTHLRIAYRLWESYEDLEKKDEIYKNQL